MSKLRRRLVVSFAWAALSLSVVLARTEPVDAESNEAAGFHEKGITVVGRSVVVFKPTRFKIVLCIAPQGKSFRDCCERYDRDLAEVNELLQRYKIPETNVQRSDTLWGREYEESLGSKILSSAGMGASSRVSGRMAIIFQEPQKIRTMLQELTKISDVTTNPVVFETTDLEQLESAARVQALGKCKDQAAALAQALGMTIGRPISIEQGKTQVHYMLDIPNEYLEQRFEQRFGSGTAFNQFDTSKYEVGKIAITQDMVATFELESVH